MGAGLIGTFLSALFKSIADTFVQLLQQQQRDASQREIERLQLANNALQSANVQGKQREAVEAEVARLSDADLLKQL